MVVVGFVAFSIILKIHMYNFILHLMIYN
jgi:hypothetical protein